ncbi:hypothetical protein NUW54_g4873 [Trametes sanguinea]|uniref:Uncharacterized protein n=1 Tax=Trametes sanguinea TaxID=158606 RepID=A0ACC1PZ86_9APHY|nr:hypothetical protein NUW54_g4873 [Trametes sanguinea]
MALENGKSPFFAGSDDEDMVEADTSIAPQGSVPKPSEERANASAQPRSPTQKPLFFADSDDEEPAQYKPAETAAQTDIPEDTDLDLDVEIPEFVDIPRASSVSSTSSGFDAPRDPSPVPRPPPTNDELRPQKRRKLSPVQQSYATTPDSMYLGSFLVDRAWSTVKGSGYVKSGEEIRIEREETS